MKISRSTIALLLLVTLPVVIAWFELSVFWAVLLVLFALIALQLITLKGIMSRPSGPELELETIQQSHFVEKVRWCMDRLGVDYQERAMAGVFGAFFRGRTVPMLSVRTGRTRSEISESSQILRYLYGRYANDSNFHADFLEPNAERLNWEQRLDRYGVSQQVWIYHHILDDPALCKLAWGAYSPKLPLWQRWTVLVTFPLLAIMVNRGFQPTRENYGKALEQADALLRETEALLSDGRVGLLGGDEIDYIDITLASLSALWLQPENFAAGRLGPDRIPPDRIPDRMGDDMQQWRERFPVTTAHLEKLYAQQRIN